MPDPGGHDGISAGDGKPCKRIGQRPSISPCSHRLTALGPASRTHQAAINGRPRLVFSRPGGTAQFRKEGFEPCPCRRCRGQPVPGKEQVGVGAAERIPLFIEQVERQPCVQLRVVDLASQQPTVLIVLDEAMIGIGGERQGTQTQGVEHGHVQQAQRRRRGLQMRNIKVNEVVADEAVAATGEFVDLRQRTPQANASQAFPWKRQRLAGCAVNGRQGVDSFVAFADFPVQGDTAHRQPGCL